jgi:regulator of cell morphogenesis and NO signaling
MDTTARQSVASLVLGNQKIVPVLEKYSIDFCCRGKMSLENACNEKGIELSAVLKDIEAVGGEETGKQMPFTEMTEAQLVNHILTTHHYYVKNIMPVIAGHLEKVATKHGDSFPYMIKVKELFGIIHKEMDEHMMKEETILFPRILEIEKHSRQGTRPTANYISGPIEMMEREHEHAGDLLFEIRRLTNHYTAPPGGCTTFQLCLSELREFEDDLHLHVHLENNILFPKALQFCRTASPRL